MVIAHLMLASAIARSSSPLAAASDPPAPASPRAEVERDFDTVLLVSVDGLRSDALIVVPGSLPAFDRLRQGASTLNARTDPDRTITLPNHTGMITGRLVEGADGHGWIRNDEVTDGETLHEKHGAYLASAFDVAHDRGARTGLFAGKPKFHLFDDSYDATRGAPDALAPDDGRDKIDRFFVDPKPAGLADALIAELSGARDIAGAPTPPDAPASGGDPVPPAPPAPPGGTSASLAPRRSTDAAPTSIASKRFYFVHFAATDLTAHAKGWDLTPGSPYMKAVADVDAALARILDCIEADARLRGTTAIVLTADHGGGAPFRSHDQAHMWVDYVIPFLVWTGGGAPTDLYARNAATRRDPGLGRPRPGDGSLGPVRNADAGNLCLDLLGFPPIPGSTVGAAQDLRAVVTATR